MYNKLFTKLLDSSIWLENQPTRIVWITFLACMDQDGVVALSSVGNVANRARVSDDEAADAINCLENPDNRNPDQEHEGRRIQRIPGVGWYVLNAGKYRDIVKAETVRAATRARVRDYRDRQKTEPVQCNAGVTDCNVSVTPSEAEAYIKNKNTARARKKKKTQIPNPFLLTAQMREWATVNTPTVDVTLETANFTDHFRNKGETGLDWVAKWRTWMRNAFTDFGKYPKGKPNNGQNQQRNSNAGNTGVGRANATDIARFRLDAADV